MEQILEKKLPLADIEFESVVPFDPAKDKLLMLDFSDTNTEITDDILADTEKFTNYINRTLKEAGATYGIGGYGENRAVYSVSSVFDAKEGTEPRRVHLGIDIWGKPHTKVMAPLDGIVHSFAFNNAYGDYGATIILAHHVNDTTFYTLYGHLSLNSLANREEGETIRKGDIFAEFGIPVENGHWPPHLHFQVIYNLEGMKGDYPGVCADSEREKYFANCPDPDAILHMMKYAEA